VKKLNLTQQKQTSQEQDGNNTQNKPIAKENLNQQSTTCLCVRKGAIKWVVVMSVIVGSSKSANFIYMLLAYNTHTHKHTILWPYFQDYPGEPVLKEIFLTLWCKGR